MLDVGGCSTTMTPRGRILMVIRLLNGRVGGAERLFCDTANLFAEAGYDVTCVYCDSTKATPFYPVSPKITLINLYGKSSRRAPWYRALDRLGKRYAKQQQPLFAPFEWLSKNAYFIRRIHATIGAVQPDVVISFLPPANTPSLIAGLFAGAKVVPTNHNVPAEDYRSPERWDQNPVDRALRLWTLYTAERVHVLFSTFGEWFPGAVRRKVVVIHNYVSPEFDGVVQPETRRKEIVAAGRIAPVKAYMDLVDAWALLAHKHPDWTVKIYGSGPEGKRLARRIRDLGLERSVLMMGHESDMKAAYLGAEILAHPALHEGFGLSVAEGLACGLPVVAYADCAGVNEFVKDGDNGLLADRSRGSEAFAEALERLIGDDALRARLRRRAPESVRPFSKQRFLDAWGEIIADIQRRAT